MEEVEKKISLKKATMQFLREEIKAPDSWCSLSANKRDSFKHKFNLSADEIDMNGFNELQAASMQRPWSSWNRCINEIWTPKF